MHTFVAFCAFVGSTLGGRLLEAHMMRLGDAKSGTYIRKDEQKKKLPQICSTQQHQDIVSPQQKETKL
jgi:hypothetical protein